MREKLRVRLSAFVRDEAHRHKDVTPDLGCLLVFFTALQGYDGCPSRDAFINAYADENSVRWVMWWQRAGTKPESMPVFQATQVSREICMFQMLVVDTIIADVRSTLKEMEATNCKLPERLEKLQAQWRQRKASTDTWATYYRHIGAPQPAFGTTEAWIAECARRASIKGPKYGGAKGEGKGSGGKGDGRSKGKGSAKGQGRR